MCRSLWVFAIAVMVSTLQGAMAADNVPMLSSPAAAAGSVPGNHPDPAMKILKSASENSYILQAAQLAAQESGNTDVKKLAESLIRSRGGYGDIGGALSGDCGNPYATSGSASPRRC